MIGLREFRSRALGLPDLLNYGALIDEGIVLGKDGSLIAGWEYIGQDLASASAQELAEHSARNNAELARLVQGWMLHFDAVRLPALGYAPVGAFSDRTTALIDEERRAAYSAQGQHFENRFVLIVTYLPPADAVHRLDEVLVGRAEAGGKVAVAQRALATFKRGLAQIEDGLGATLHLRRLGSVRVRCGGVVVVYDELLRHLLLCMTGKDQLVRQPPLPTYLDGLLGAGDFRAGLRPMIGREHIGIVAICGFPAESIPAMLDHLNTLPFPLRWSTRFIPLDTPNAHAQMNRFRSHWAQLRLTLMNLIRPHIGGEATHVDAHADAMVADAIAAIGEASSGIVKFGYHTSVVVLFGPHADVVEDNARTVVKEVNRLGFVARTEDVNAVEAYLGSQPGHGYPNVRRPLVHTLNVADLLPVTSVWPGLAFNPSPYYPPESPPLAYALTNGATPFRLNLHVSDVGHTLLLGPPGSGKSTLLAFLIVQFFRYLRARVFAFDKGYSLYPTCIAAGGAYYEIGAERGPTFAPLAHVDQPSERRWAASWLETLLTLQGLTVEPRHRLALHRALELLAAAPSRTLTDLIHTVQDVQLREALLPYSLGGQLGSLLDAERDGLDESQFVVFELDHITGLGENNFIAVLFYLVHWVERCLGAGDPALLAFGEVWQALSHPVFRAQIGAWLRTLRKRNCAAILETQAVTDITNSPIRDVLIESCPTKIFLPNAEATTESSRAAYAALGLGEAQIDLIAHATPKAEYYYTSPLGRRLFSLGLGPIALSFLGAGGTAQVRRVRELAAADPASWPATWLAERGLATAAARWLALRQPLFEPQEVHS